MHKPQNRKVDQASTFLNQFIYLFEDVLQHDGYANMQIEVRNIGGFDKEILLRYGKEYRYKVNGLFYRNKKKTSERYFKVSRIHKKKPVHEKREGKKERRKEERRKNMLPRDFRLEKRIGVDRRKRY